MLDLDGFADYLYEEELSQNTIGSYMLSAKRFDAMFGEISKKNVLAYKQWLLERFKPQTVNLRLTAIMRYCSYKEIPMKVKSIKEPRKTHIDNVITAEQFEHLTKSLKADGEDRWLAMVLLLGKTGARISEALRITKADLLAGSVTMHTKAHMRTIYFPKSLVEDLESYLKDMPDNAFVMQNVHGKTITSRGVSGRLLHFANKYDIPKEVMHPHSFRHFFAVEFLKRNNNIALLADLLGHGSVNITQIYLRQSQEQQQAAIDKAVDW